MVSEIITSYFVPLFFILGITLFNSIIFKKKFEIAVTFGLIESALITYIFGFIDLRIGFVCFVGIAVSSVPLCIYANRKKRYDLWENYLTDLFWAFLVLYTIVFVMNLGKAFYKWDEYSHWGMMAKEMVRLDKYYYVEDSVLVHHREYPPFTAVVQYIWCKLCGSYDERHLYNAKIILSLLTFFPIYSWLTEKVQICTGKMGRLFKVALTPVLFILLSSIMELGEASYYRTIYTEGVLCALFLYAIFSVMMYEKGTVFFVLNMIMVLSAIVLTKQMGLYFCAIVIAFYLLLKFVNKKIADSKWEILFVLIGPIVSWGMWKIATSLNTPPGQFDVSKFSLESILNIISGKGLEYQYVTIDVYWDTIFHKALLYKPLGLSYVVILILFAVLMLAVLKLKRDKNEKREILILTFLLESAAIAYIFVMQVLYLFGFSEGESMGLASYERYMTTMLYPMLLTAILFLITALLSKCKWNQNIIVVLMIFVLVGAVIPGSFIKENLLPGVFYDDPADLYKGDARIIMENTEEDAKIYLICQGDNGSGRNMIAYLTSPRAFSVYNYTLSGSEAGSLSVAEMLSYASEYDYVYLSNIDDTFVEYYAEAFPSLTLTNQQLFKVSEEMGKVIFKRVY